jgi:hypothetical protein
MIYKKLIHVKIRVAWTIYNNKHEYPTLVVNQHTLLNHDILNHHLIVLHC